MAEDRLKKDYDTVENLSDLIKAREERTSALSDDVDAMDDIAESEMTADPQKELSFPHKHGQSEDQIAGRDVELMDTHDESEVEFDWQDSVEEMEPTDPPPDEGMGMDEEIEELAEVDVTELTGPAPSTEDSSEMATAATDEEKAEYDLDGGEKEERCPPISPIPLDDAMETDSDEDDFSIQDKFEGEMDRDAALLEMEEIREIEAEREIED